MYDSVHSLGQFELFRIESVRQEKDLNGHPKDSLNFRDIDMFMR